MKVEQERIVTAQVKITKPDGRVIVEEVQMTDEEKRKFLDYHDLVNRVSKDK